MSEIRIIKNEESSEKKLGCTEEEFRKKVKNIFASNNINFLIGAGYSFGRLGVLGDVEKMIEENNKREPETENEIKGKKIIDGFLLYKFFKKCIYEHGNDIEKNESFKESDAFINGLSALLNKRNDKNLIKRVNIFTTNYDMFMEISLENNENAYTFYNDGFKGRLSPVFETKNYNTIFKRIVQNTEREAEAGTINLYKMHGSLSWDTCDKNDEIKKIIYTKNVKGILDEINGVGEFYETPIYRQLEHVEENISELEGKLKVLKDKSEDLEERNNYLKETVGEIEVAKDEESEMMWKMRELKEQGTECYEQITEYEEQITEYEEQITKYEEQITEYEEQIIECVDQIKNCKKEKKELEENQKKELEENQKKELEKTKKFIKEYKKLNIINPTKKKFAETVLNNTYYELLRMYSNELEKNNTILFVFGFSFQDEHIRTITKRALANPSMTMYIFLYKKDILEEYKKFFKDFNNVKYVYCEDGEIDLKEFTSIMFGN